MSTTEAKARAAARLMARLGPIAMDGWVVGGGLRDAMLGRPVADVDLAVRGDPAAVARTLARAHRAGRFRLSHAFGAWRVHGGSLPFTVDVVAVQGSSIEDDLTRRDFTVNAMALPVAGGGLVDPHGGLRDLERRTLRLVRPSALRDDPVRLVRLARLAVQLGFDADPRARAQARADAGELARPAPERVMGEIARIARLPEAWRGFELLDDLRVLGVVWPQLEAGRGLEQTPYHHLDVLGHTLEVVRRTCEIAADPEPVFRSLAPRVAERLQEPLADELRRGQALVLGSVMHDMAKPATAVRTPEGRMTFMGHDRLGAEMADAWCRRMRTSTRLRETLGLMVLRHLSLGFLVHRQPLSLRQIDRYLRATAPAEVEIVVLSVADRLATRGARTTEAQIVRHLDLARQVLATHFELVDRGPIRPIVPGDRLARLLDRPPGRWTAELLEALREEQLVGRVTTPEQAERFAAAWAASREGGTIG
jgi:tRNA nucleotidyltransferase/poly(A) polymerase